MIGASFVGLQSRCKSCANESYRDSRAKKPHHYNNVKRARVALNKKKIDEWKGQQGCKFCSEDEACCLDLHHLDPNAKEANPSDLVGWSVEAFMEEAKKCIVVCRNCHAKIHAGIVRV